MLCPEKPISRPIFAKFGRRQRRRRGIIEPTLQASVSEAVKGG